ncbi:MAG: AraC family transcriptional regulator [Limnobacter sp.]|nr:AraC family transcriptional regulator [Limnobacter sp.]
MTAPTALATWMKGLAQHLKHLGHSPEQLFEQAGLDYALMDQPEARFPVIKTTRLWQLAVEQTGDEALGLKTIRFITPTSFHSVGMSVLASRTLNEAFQRLSKFGELITDASEMLLQPQADNTVELAIRLRGDVQPAFQSTDGFMALLANVGKALGSPELLPLRVELIRPPPAAQHLDFFDKVFCTEVLYGQAQMKLVFTQETVNAPLTGANAAIAAHLDQASSAAIEKLKPTHGCAYKVRQLIEAVVQKRSGEPLPSAEDLARQMNMSSRNLQRKLADEGVTLVEMMDQIKKDAAERRLKDDKDPITAIALDLGFSDASAFSRACKRWFGVSPSQIRTGKG